MTKRLLLSSILSSFFALAGSAQFFLGLNSSGYGGINNVDYNPAIADNPFFLDINLISAGATVENNYVGLSRQAIYHPSDFSDPNLQQDYLNERVNGKPKDLYIGAQVLGPLSFMVSFGKKSNKNKNAFAFSYHANFMFNLDNVDQTLARTAYYGLGYKADSITNFLGKSLTNANVALKTMAWLDYDFTYSRVVLEKGPHMLKVGGTLKLLQGVEGGYLYVNNLSYKWPNYDTLSIFKTSANYAYSSSFPTSLNYSPQQIQSIEASYLKSLLNFSKTAPSVAVNLGATYEWRPDLDSYKYTMDGQEQWRYDQTRYKVAAGFSVIDLGAVKFNRGPYSGNFTANIQNWDVGDVKFPNGLQSFDDTVRSHFQVSQNTKSTFTMWLPTRFNMFVDYNIAYGFGLNCSAIISPNLAQDRNMVHEVSTFSITPKYDYSYFGFYLPISYDVMGNFNLGTTLRIGPLTLGSSDILGLFAKKYIYNLDFHAALKITIPYHKLHDRDKDGVSDKLDKCPDVKGTLANHGCPERPDRDGDGVPDDVDRCPDDPGPVALHGCPDADSDGIADIDDSCPHDPGPLKYHGCPDRDSDGIIDKLDECPDQPGLPQFNGCPDRDGDGVPDKLDMCPDVPGSKEHHGCPDTDGDGVYDDEDQCILTPGPKENHGCPWPDRDGDGIPDKDDECPDVFGVPENHGCPLLEKKEIETVKYAFENLEFATGKDIIQTHSFASLNALANLLISKANYGLRIEGHTDNVGSDESNLILSQKRSDAVKNYLIKRGVDAGKLESFGYGASRPIADNDTPEGKQKNRRVEMKITFK